MSEGEDVKLKIECDRLSSFDYNVTLEHVDGSAVGECCVYLASKSQL